ncbi:ABC transporter permease [Actinocatenispora thailandica]|uniref:ABC transporter permease n=1 Tax=Actinocatenispora thailandica TaxID=227318 RepID=A0A7R7HVH4_9ACTN|nr:ABC transporter permease [Actinocatenispora thailandica]BCJ32884.1 ABC transporter permease [Actinocatenispora thailandica]
MSDPQYDGPGALSAIGGVRLIARRELATRLRAKSFLVSTVIIVVFICGYLVLMNFIGNSTSSATVGLTGQTSTLATPLGNAAKATGQKVDVRTVDERAGRRQVADGKLDALLVGTADAPTVVVKKNLPSGLGNTFTVLAQHEALTQQIVALKGDPSAVRHAMATAKLPVQRLEPVGGYQVERIVLGIIAVILIYMSLMINGQAVAQGVIEEKSSRVVELLLATVRPWQLMAGKVLGIAVVGLIQMVIFAVVGAGLGLATGVLSIPASLLTGAAVWAIVWYVIGFAMYAVMLAAAGALVSRQEDANAVVTPVIMMIVVPAVIGWSLIPANPDGMAGRVLSLIPLFSPMIMPMRISLGVAAPWEIVLSVVLSLVLVVGLVALAGRVYRNAVLRTGARVRLVDALRAA